MAQIKLDIEQHDGDVFGVRFPHGTEFIDREGLFRWPSVMSAQEAVTHHLELLRLNFVHGWTAQELSAWAGVSIAEADAQLDMLEIPARCPLCKGLGRQVGSARHVEGADWMQPYRCGLLHTWEAPGEHPSEPEEPELEPEPEPHMWEEVNVYSRRMRVPSGWLYQIAGSAGVVFVPFPSECSHCGRKV